MFKKISSTETAKEAWTILQTTYEGKKTTRSDENSTKSGEIFVGSRKIFTKYQFGEISIKSCKISLWSNEDMNNSTILPQATIIQGDNEFNLSDHPK